MDWNYLFKSFDGRISRQPFWIGMVVLMLAQLVLNTLIGILFGDGVIGGLLAFVVAVALLYPSFAVLVKRFHDRGKSGWWSLIVLVPILGVIWIIVDAGILPGTPGPNEYGADPLASGAGAAALGRDTSHDGYRDHHADTRGHDGDYASAGSSSDGGPSSDRA